MKQFIGRAVTLILWPILLYMAFFYIHLQVLNRSGNGDGFYSSAFQSQLIGNSLHNATMPRQVAYGAVLTLKNFKTGGGYLHSHYHLYPKGMGARQQQVRFIIATHIFDSLVDSEIEMIRDWQQLVGKQIPFAFWTPSAGYMESIVVFNEQILLFQLRIKSLLLPTSVLNFISFNGVSEIFFPFSCSDRIEFQYMFFR